MTSPRRQRIGAWGGGGGDAYMCTCSRFLALCSDIAIPEEFESISRLQRPIILDETREHNGGVRDVNEVVIGEDEVVR